MTQNKLFPFFPPMNQQDDQELEEQRKLHHRTVEIEGIGCLPLDLISEILSKLPAKVLCRYRCVSKSWHCLLTQDDEFMARHMERSKQRPLLLVRRYLSDGIGELDITSKIAIELTSIDVQGDVTDKFKEVIDGPNINTFISCGPLSIMCSTHSLYVCNPSIHEIVRVPCHPDTRLCNVGFGYLPKSREYKIVHLFYGLSVGDGKMGCEVFSFRFGAGVSSGSWKRIQDCPFSVWTDEYPVCVNGVIYWALSSGWKDKSILSLDLEREEFSSISYPVHESRKYGFLECVGLIGSLCVVGFSSEASIMDIWMLKGKKNKVWVMECSVNLFPLCPKFLIPYDDQSEEILVHMEQMDLICYNVKSHTSRRTDYYKAMKAYNKPCFYYGSIIPMSTSGI